MLEHFERRTGQKYKIIDGSFAFDNGLKFNFVVFDKELRAPNEESVKKKAFIEFSLVLKGLLENHAFDEEMQPYFVGRGHQVYDELFVSSDLQEALSLNFNVRKVRSPNGFFEYKIITNDAKYIEKGCAKTIYSLLLEEETSGLLPLVKDVLFENKALISQLAIYSPDAKKLLNKLNAKDLRTREYERPFIVHICEDLVTHLSNQWNPHRQPHQFKDKIEIVIGMFNEIYKVLNAHYIDGSLKVDAVLVEFLDKNKDKIKELSEYMISARKLLNRTDFKGGDFISRYIDAFRYASALEILDVTVAILELLESYTENPLNDKEILIGDARVKLNNGRDGRIRISSIDTLNAGQGAASKALNTILAVADKHGIGVELIASPYGSEELSTGQLKSWYARHGFVSDGSDDGMVRAPRVDTDNNESVQTLTNPATIPNTAPKRTLPFPSLKAIKQGATQNELRSLEAFQERAARDDAVNEIDKVTGKVDYAYRPHQKEFRESMWLACGGQCVITGSRLSGALQAAHKGSANDWKTNNTKGWLLKADMHLLLDAKVPTLKISESGVIWMDSQHQNEPEYRFHGTTIPMVDLEDPSTWPINRKHMNDVESSSLTGTASLPSSMAPVQAVSNGAESDGVGTDAVEIVEIVFIPVPIAVQVPDTVPAMGPSDAGLKLEAIMRKVIDGIPELGDTVIQDAGVEGDDARKACLKRTRMRM